MFSNNQKLVLFNLGAPKNLEITINRLDRHYLEIIHHLKIFSLFNDFICYYIAL